MRVYQNPDPSSRQAMEPPMRWTWGMGSPTTWPLATSKMCNVPSSVPCSDSETARRFPSADGTNQSIVVSPDGSMASGSTTMRSVRVSSRSVRATRNGRCRGV